MPRIDTEGLKTGFKKKEYRAWDNNLLETLKMPKENLEADSTSPSSKNETDKDIEQNQSVDLGFNQGSIRVQLESNQGANRVQSGLNKGSIGVQLESNQGSIRVQANQGNRVQLGFKEGDLCIDELVRKLGGNEQKIFFYLIEICIARGSSSTGEIPGKVIVDTIGTTRNGMETAIKRLRKKGLILREKGKTGKNGLMNIAISDTVKNEAIKYLHGYQSSQEVLHQGSIRVQTDLSNRVQLGFNNSLYSSSNKNTTTVLPEEWKKINFLPLESIGFSEQHLLDIYTTNLCEPAIVQESIYHFAFGLEEGRHKQYDSPLKVFIGRLRKGNAWIESNYESPKEKALRELLERKKAEKEKRDAMIKELVDIEFPAWRKKLTQDEIKQIVPADALKTNIAPAITAALRTHYVDNILLPKLVNNKFLDDGSEYKNEGKL
ncbi:MAG: hypothetical protein JO149_05255 [Gammaproteobacteria bacterium]|nr:hypothetical protein [Gammaproteobacteria bacterium]